MDAVNSPDHYTQGYIETIYTIAQVLGPEGFKAYCMGNWIKYSSRHKLKGGEEDLRKAEVYLGWATNGLPDPVNGKLPPPAGERAYIEGDIVVDRTDGKTYTVEFVDRKRDLYKLRRENTILVVNSLALSRDFERGHI